MQSLLTIKHDIEKSQRDSIPTLQLPLMNTTELNKLNTQKQVATGKLTNVAKTMPQRRIHIANM